MVARQHTLLCKHYLFLLFSVIFWLGMNTAAPSYAEEINYDEILERLQNQVQTLSIPLVADGRDYGEINTTLRGESIQALDAKRFILALPFNPRTVAQLTEIVQAGATSSDAISENATLRPVQLDALDITLVYDPVALQLVVSIPLQRMALQFISHRGTAFNRKPQSASDDASFFINSRYGFQNFTRQLPASQDIDSRQHTLDLDSAFTLHNWTLEGAGQWLQNKTDLEDSGNKLLWRKNYLRLIHDDIDRGARFTFGDLSYSTKGFQRFNALSGLAYASNRQLNAYRVGRETGGESFFIDDDSKVEIYVNSRLVRSLYLQRGHYEVRDLPGVSGINDVRLQISNAQGEQTELNYSFVFSQQLLAPGEHDFSYNLGALRNDQAADSRHGDKPLLSLYHHYGFAANFTAGVNIQATEGHYMPGFELQMATVAGAFSGRFASSFMAGSPSANATLLQYRFEKRTLGQVNLSWQFFEPTFSTPHAQNIENTPTNINNLKSQALVHFSKAFGSRLIMHASYRASTARNGGPANDSWTLNFATRIFNRLRINASATRSERDGAWEETSYQLNLSWQRFQPEQFYDAQYASPNESYRVTYANRLYHQQHSLGTQLFYEQSQPAPQPIASAKNTRKGLTSRYENHRFDAALTWEGLDSPTGLENISRFGVGGALVMAGNQWALSKPVSGSFVVVNTDVPLGNNVIGLNPRTGGGYESLITDFSAGVISGVSPYFSNYLAIDAQGTDLEYQSYLQNIETLSGYRAGSLVNLAGDDKKIVEGQLISKGHALEYIAGEIIHTDTGESHLFFTDGEGLFLVENVHPGQYTMTLFGEYSEAPLVIIPSEGEKRIRLAPITIYP